MNALARVVGSVLASAIVTAVMATGAVVRSPAASSPGGVDLRGRLVIGAAPRGGCGGLVSEHGLLPA